MFLIAAFLSLVMISCFSSFASDVEEEMEKLNISSDTTNSDSEPEHYYPDEGEGKRAHIKYFSDYSDSEESIAPSETDSSSIFDKAKSKKSNKKKSSDLTVTYSITTTSFPQTTTTPSALEILAPDPQEIEEFKGKRVPKHQKTFKEVTGYKSAKIYLEDIDSENSMENPQIGHAQGYQNHGAAADTYDDNLAVISQPANLAMNVADNLYRDEDVDGNYHVIEEGTYVAKFSVQQLLDPEDEDYPKTLPVVIAANLKRQDRGEEQKEKLKEQVHRAFSQERIAEIEDYYEKYPDKRLSREEYQKLLLKKNKKWEREGKKTQKVVKFPNESRKNRRENSGDEV